MNRIFIAIIYTVLIFNLSAQGKEIFTQVQSVTLYHLGAEVKRISTTQLDEGTYELVFNNLSSKMVLNSLKIKNSEVTILNKSLITKLSDEQVNVLKDRRTALQKQLELIDLKYEEKGFIADVDELDKMTDFYTIKVVDLKKELREIDRELANNEQMRNISLDNESAAILRLTVTTASKMKEPLQLQYVCGAVGWTPAYEINVENAESEIMEVKFLARTMNQSGEDWENTTFKLSSSYPLDSPNQLPKPDSPWVLTPENRRVNQSGNQSSYQRNNNMERLEGVTYSDILVPSNLTIREIQGEFSLKSNGSVFILPVKTMQLSAQFFYYVFPSLDPEVYLAAKVQDWEKEGLIDGVANISFDGNDIGKSIIRFSDFQDTLILPVAKDNSIFLKRSEIADQKYMNETAIGKKQKSTLAYQFEIKNNNSFPVSLTLVDQIPISQTKSADVDIDELTGGRYNSETGEVQWLILLQPGETTHKELFFTVTTDPGYSPFKRKTTSAFRTISCPSF